MNALEIPAKEASPFIKFDPNGKLEIKGKSFDDDVVPLYRLVLQKVKEFEASGKKNLEVNIYLKYFNTASSKCLFDLISALKELHEEKGVNVKMEWNYIEGDESMKEEIEEFHEEIDFDFQILPEKDYPSKL